MPAFETMGTLARLGACFGVIAAIVAAPSAARAQDPAPVTYAPRPAPVAGPRVISDWEEGEPVPPGYQPVQRARRGLVIGGAVTAGTLYFITVLVAAANSDAARRRGESSETNALYIPAVGPFVQMTRADTSTASVFLAIDGLAQTGGIVMFITGLALPKTVLVRDSAWTPRTMTFAPLMMRGTSGLSMVGTF